MIYKFVGGELCGACGDSYLTHELVEQTCFGCRYLRYLTAHDPLVQN